MLQTLSFSLLALKLSGSCGVCILLFLFLGVLTVVVMLSSPLHLRLLRMHVGFRKSGNQGWAERKQIEVEYDSG